MKTALLFLMLLVFGTLAMHIDVDKDEFWEDSDIEYLNSEVYDSDSLIEMMKEQHIQLIDASTMSSTTASNNIYQFLPSTTPKKIVTPSIGTWNSVNTGNTLNTGNSMNSGNSMNTVSNSWQETVSKSQKAILSEAFFKVYKELTSSYQQDGVTSAFPPLSCQTVVIEQKMCFICPPAFGILRMFDSRCNWIPAVKSAVETLNKDKFQLMSDDVYEDLRQIYAKLQMNSPAESTIGETQLDFPVIFSKQPKMPIASGYSIVLPDDPAVTKMADFAVKELTYNIKTVKSSYVFNGITSAEKQIGAGANYRINLDFIDKNNSKHLYCSVEVSQSLAALDISSLTSHVCI
ncbi:hypothetical protein DAPPUDRAFT_300137 [Daphnia pulex]|uniref:Cystatin domain-containing protein n=1 Tax=Daphnia pulex TaxID=6669 RepID=E9FR51_DAPPU|nr:hypothetical protein DAPPUDRAFT_300137 [Daphnia pulex]|eukprot:EFX90101.1 hypothetical protein DAPPUDRAFT_300137 [Daphnia pulex]